MDGNRKERGIMASFFYVCMCIPMDDGSNVFLLVLKISEGATWGDFFLFLYISYAVLSLSPFLIFFTCLKRS